MIHTSTKHPIPSIKLDGSYGEGGGQIVRASLALSSLAGTPFKVSNIRAGRKKPGLKAQHVACIEGLTLLSGASAVGGTTGSDVLSFTPGQPKGRTLPLDVGTAGSLSLVLQCLLLPACFANDKVRLKLKGGTDVKWSPSVDYFNKVILPFYTPFADITFDLKRRGFYPKGGGKLELTVRPKYPLKDTDWDTTLKQIRSELPPIILTERGRLTSIRGISFASNALEKQDVATRQRTGVRQAFGEKGLNAKLDCEYHDTASIGTVVTIWGIFEGADVKNTSATPTFGAEALGEKHIRAEDVGKMAGNKLLKELEGNGALDSHLADNLIPLLGLVGGRIRPSAISEHTLTNMHTTEKFLPVEFEVEDGVIIAHLK